MEDGRHHRAGRRSEGRHRLGIRPSERPDQHRARGRAQSPDRRLLHAASVDDPLRQGRQRDRIVRRAAGSRHGRRQQGLRVPRAEHGPQIRHEDRQAGRRDRAHSRDRRRRYVPTGSQPSEPRARPGQRGTRCGIPPAASRSRPRRRSWRQRRPGRARGRGCGIPREVSADDADDRRGHRGDPRRRGGERDVRRRQLSRRPRDGVRPDHAEVQARVGRVRSQADGDQHERRRPRLQAERCRCRRSSPAT